MFSKLGFPLWLFLLPLDDLIVDVSDVHHKKDVVTKIVLHVSRLKRKTTFCLKNDKVSLHICFPPEELSGECQKRDNFLHDPCVKHHKLWGHSCTR